MAELLESSDQVAGNVPGVAQVRADANRIIDQLERVIVGKRDVLARVVTALLCEGHVLLEDVPGIGKTTLALAVAAHLQHGYKDGACFVALTAVSDSVLMAATMLLQILVTCP